MNFLQKHLSDYFLIGRYIISGASGVVINIIAIFILTDIFELWYLASAVITFFIHLTYTFTLHKYWTFKDRDTTRIQEQGTWYTIVALVGLGLNTLILYVLVELFVMWYLIAQVIALGIVSVSSFVLNKTITFKDSVHEIADTDTDN